MTLLRPDLRAAPVCELTDADRAALVELLDADPYPNAVLASRLRTTGTLRAAQFGGTVLGIPADDGLSAAAYSGGNLLPVGGTDDDWATLARRVAASPRTCTSIVGRAEAVHAMWRVLYPVWGRARNIRYAQPLLVAEHPPAVPVDSRVRAIRRDEIDAYLRAAVAMFSEELGIPPAARSAYRRRVEWMINASRAFGIVDGSGSVVFKADLGAVSAHTCQLQGVWVRPDLRRRGIGTAALAAVIEHALTLAPTVSLYVNDFNEPARRMYARLGMREVATLATVLL